MIMSNPQAAQHLWQRVVLQALRDAIADRKDPDAEQRLATMNAINWLDAGGRDFQQTCSLAGLEPDRVRGWWARVRDDADAMRAAARKFKDNSKFKAEEDRNDVAEY